MSGGERTRLQLLILMLAEPNCLVLDEPTNHLDIGSLEVLERELERFPGTVVFVSHDRYFLDRISDKTVEVRDGELFRYEGGYSAWREGGRPVSPRAPRARAALEVAEATRQVGNPATARGLWLRGRR